MSWVAAAIKIVEWIDRIDTIIEELPKKLKEMSDGTRAPEVFGIKIPWDLVVTVAITKLLTWLALLDKVRYYIEGLFTGIESAYDSKDIKAAEKQQPTGAPSASAQFYKSTNANVNEVNSSSSYAKNIAKDVMGGDVYITSVWGEPRAGHTHKGWDLRARTPVPLYAPFDAYIARAVPNLDGNGGGLRVLMHSKDGVGVYVMHLSSVNVRAGQNVSKGTVIGMSGASGFSSMSRWAHHVHFEIGPVSNGVFTHVDPFAFRNVAPALESVGGIDISSKLGQAILENDRRYPGREHGYGVFIRQAASTTVAEAIEESKKYYRSASLSFKDKVRYIYKILIPNLGLNSFAVSGIIGNLWQESGLNEYTDARVARGLACWESWAWPIYKNRYGVEMASRNDNYRNQVDFLSSQLSDNQALVKSLKESHNIEQATATFCTQYERPSKPNLLRRIQLAYAAYQIYAEQAEQKEAVTSYINNEYHKHVVISQNIMQSDARKL